MTPSLRNEVTLVLLRDSLGVFPLFALMGVSFQRAVYPRLKPVSYSHLEVIYARGDLSEDLYFLRKGMVDVLAGGEGTEVLYRINQGQYFGEEVLANMRRGSHVISNGLTELWTLSREDIDDVIRKLPELKSKFTEFVVEEVERKQRLNALSYRILIGVAQTPERRAVLIVQKAWAAFANRKAKAASLFAADVREVATSPSRIMSHSHQQHGAEAAINPALNAALNDIQSQLSAMKRAMGAQSDLIRQQMSSKGTKSKKDSPAISTYEV